MSTEAHGNSNSGVFIWHLPDGPHVLASGETLVFDFIKRCVYVRAANQ